MSFAPSSPRRPPLPPPPCPCSPMPSFAVPPFPSPLAEAGAEIVGGGFPPPGPPFPVRDFPARRNTPHIAGHIRPLQIVPHQTTLGWLTRLPPGQPSGRPVRARPRGRVGVGPGNGRVSGRIRTTQFASKTTEQIVRSVFLFDAARIYQWPPPPQTPAPPAVPPPSPALFSSSGALPGSPSIMTSCV